MLVVVSIMMILVAVSASAFRPANDSRRIREAARQINLYLGSARNRAMETGRPCGVTFHLFNPAGGVAFAMSADQCETPPTFAGDTADAAVKVQNWTMDATGTNYYWANHATVLKLQVRVDDFPPDRTLHWGDLVQLNGQGPLYSIIDDSANAPAPPDFTLLGGSDDAKSINFSDGVDSNSDDYVDNHCLTLALDPLYAQQVPWPTRQSGNWSQPVSFRIFRSPVTVSSLMKGGARSLQLPAATVVDLVYSGCGAGQQFNSVASDVTILFAPNGSVESVFCNGASAPVTDSIFLLVGKRERMLNVASFSPTNTDQTTVVNCQDMTNLWVVINPQTGLVTTGEVGSPTAATLADVIIASRALAADSQGMGGK